MHDYLRRVRPIQDECYFTIAHNGRTTNPFHALEQLARCTITAWNSSGRLFTTNLAHIEPYRTTTTPWQRNGTHQKQELFIFSAKTLISLEHI
ncbi:MAG: hypothetical protein Q7S71_03250 [Candidatus Nitrotoga sp.]|nr:hypothetical protein [Candidatus Nitrotoga sp.]